MKKVIFTCGSLTIGGVQKSLVNLLKNIDYNEFEVHLVLSTLSGELITEVPKQVRIIKAPKFFVQPVFSKRSFLKDLKFISTKPVLYLSFCLGVITALRLDSKHARELFWSKLKKYHIYPQLEEDKYDIAISFAGGIGIWNQVVIDRINANKKICWIHGDYSVFSTKSEQSKEYLVQFNQVVAVSQKAERILLEEVPQLLGKTTVINNIVDRENILRLANSETVYVRKSDEIRLISVSRLDKGKGFDLAIKAFSKVVDRGLNLRWDIVGDGPERSFLANLIKKLNMENNIRLLGKKINPYPYVNGADIFFHPSKGEGKSIAVEEAKVLQKPILITDYPTVRDQIEHHHNGIIVKITDSGLHNGILEMVSDVRLRNNLSNNLFGYNPDEKIIDEIKIILECN